MTIEEQEKSLNRITLAYLDMASQITHIVNRGRYQSEEETLDAIQQCAKDIEELATAHLEFLRPNSSASEPTAR